MRHQVAGKKLNRNTKQRKALFRSLLGSFFIHGQIKTTEGKARAMRGLAEKVITKARLETLSSRRLIASFLQSQPAVEKVVKVWGPLFKHRPGGFTRIVRLGKRLGDGAVQARLEMVDRPVEVKKQDENQDRQKK